MTFACASRAMPGRRRGDESLTAVVFSCLLLHLRASIGDNGRQLAVKTSKFARNFAARNAALTHPQPGLVRHENASRAALCRKKPQCSAKNRVQFFSYPTLKLGVGCSIFDVFAFGPNLDLPHSTVLCRSCSGLRRLAPVCAASASPLRRPGRPVNSQCAAFNRPGPSPRRNPAP